MKTTMDALISGCMPMTRYLLLVLAGAVLQACGGGGGSNDRGAGPSTGSTAADPDRVGLGWVRIDRSELVVSTLVLTGEAFVTEDNGSVTITWLNQTTGASGKASQGPTVVNVLFPVVARQVWSARVPLGRGGNMVVVTATDGAGNIGRARLTATGDATPPAVTGASPADGATDVAIGGFIAVTFSEPMAAASISSATLRVEDAARRAVPGAVTYADSVATFTPATPFEALTTYHATVTAGVTDVTGNALAADYTFRFDTGRDPGDRIPPTVNVLPADGATCVARDTPIEVWFSERVVPSSVGLATLLLKDAAGNPVSGSLELGLSGSYLFRPAGLLAPSSSHTFVVTTGVRDLAGNPLASDDIFAFRTATAGPGLWMATRELDAPAARREHSAVWTGTELIVWGGLTSGTEVVGDGARYRTATDSWLPISSSAAPEARWGHLAAWTGNRMLIWGGWHSSAVGRSRLLSSGGSYDPHTDAWTSMSLAGAPPAPREFATAVWTGTELIVWGGRGVSGPLADGARYRPDTNTWSPVSNVGAPSARSSHVAVWTGTQMIVWGGSSDYAALASGASYDPATDSWMSLPIDVETPSARFGATAVWTGAEMIVWGGSAVDWRATGARFDPASHSWRSMSVQCEPASRVFHTAVWTGSEMLVWGGSSGGGSPDYSSGGRYDPSTDLWEPLSTVRTPDSRSGHTASWTGTEMIIWGGFTYGGAARTGGRYQPY